VHAFYSLKSHSCSEVSTVQALAMLRTKLAFYINNRAYILPVNATCRLEPETRDLYTHYAKSASSSIVNTQTPGNFSTDLRRPNSKIQDWLAYSQLGHRQRTASLPLRRFTKES